MPHHVCGFFKIKQTADISTYYNRKRLCILKKKKKDGGGAQKPLSPLPPRPAAALKKINTLCSYSSPSLHSLLPAQHRSHTKLWPTRSAPPWSSLGACTFVIWESSILHMSAYVP